MPNFPNLPKTQVTRGDGGLRVSPTDANPKVLLLGTALQGPGNQSFNARDLGQARTLFGQTSELYQSLIEVKKAYGESANIWLYRIGTTPAELQIGDLTTSSGVIKVLVGDVTATIGADWKASYNQPSGWLWVYNELGTLVYSNTPTNAVDLGEVEVRGNFTLTSGTQFGDVTGGTLASSVTLTAAGALTGNSFTNAVTGGEIVASGNLQMRYEALQDAYRLLESEDLDIVVPIGVSLDDNNVAFFTSGVVGGQPWTDQNNPQSFASGTLGWFKETAPAEGSSTGNYTYQWATDVIINDTAVGAQGWASNTARIAAGFREVSFAHQLANFCYQQTKNESTCFGVIGVKAPSSYSLSDIHAWIGQTPTLNAAGTFTANGFGLLGHPQIGGSTSTKLNPLTHDDATGRNPGFFATTSEFLDEAALNDEGGNPIDIGAYLNVVGEWPLHINSTGSIVGYSATAAPYYAGLIGRLDEKNSPTNELCPGLRVPYRAGKQRWDDLTISHIVMMQQRPTGAFVIDAPTFAREASDYRRLTTVRLVGLAENVVRVVAEKYIGKASNAITKAAFEGDIEEELQKLTKRGYLKRFEFAVATSLLEDILGQARVKLLLVVPNELRQVFASVALGVE